MKPPATCVWCRLIIRVTTAWLTFKSQCPCLQSNVVERYLGSGRTAARETKPQGQRKPVLNLAETGSVEHLRSRPDRVKEGAPRAGSVLPKPAIGTTVQP